MANSSLCIVLRASNYKENDKMLTLFSREWGRIDALARGCRKPASSLLAASDVLCCAEYAFHIKDGRYYITQAVPKTNFYDIRKNMNALMTALLLLEICEKTVMPAEPNGRLFALLAGALYALANGSDHKKVLLFFVYKMLDIQGLRPMLDACVLCGSEPATKINIAAGGVVCEHCTGEKVPPQYIEMIAGILHTPSKNIHTTELSYDKDFYNLGIRWLRSSLESEPKTLSLLH
ncbi:MAG: DNA repair protein RecO [Clostridia bacterium]|nr:DNA repair protein RecO [Clostridia bacterium]